MGPSRAGVETFHSSSNSGIFFQGNMNPNVGPVSTNITNNLTTSGPSITANSMITDANSTLSGSGPPHLQRNTSFNMESYNRLPASPLSFSSNNLSNLGSSVIDSNQDNISQLQKKPRLDIKQEDLIQQQVVQQILQNPNPNPQLQALIQQQRLRQQQQQQQQQLLQSLPPVQRAHLLQQQQLRQLQNGSAVKRPYDNGVCSRRLMQYLYHQRQRPADNSIAYWRKFVVEYYSPRAKTRWCLSLYDNVGHHSLGVFPQSNVDAWQCDICGTKSGRGFEATFEVLPRLNEIKFSSGVTDELLFLDLPRETRFNTGLMMLEYGKAVQESIYDQLRVVRQGQLKVIFTPDLKILNWEFCARRHEELLPRRLIAPQVNQLLQVAQKCQSTIAESGSDGVSQQDLQTNSNMVVTAWRQLARSLELQSLNDLGFSKRYVRCLQISEVVSSMKDLMDLCQETKVGPIEGLKSFPRQGSGPGPFNNRAGPPSGSAQSAITLTNYQNMLMRQKSMNSNSQPESPSVSNPNPNPNPNPNGPFQGWPDNRFPNTQQPPPAQQLSHGGGGGAKPSVSGQTVGPDSNGSTRSNSFKRAQTGPQDIVGEIGSEFNGNEFFNNNDDFEDIIGDFGWKE